MPICILNSKWSYLAWYWSYKKVQKIIFHDKIISARVYFLNFCISMSGFWVIVKNAISHLLSRPQVVRFWQILTAWGLESKRNFAFFNNSKTACLRAKTCIKHPSWNYFFGEKMFLKFFCSSKIEGVTVILISKYKWAWHA